MAKIYKDLDVGFITTDYKYNLILSDEVGKCPCCNHEIIYKEDYTAIAQIPFINGYPYKTGCYTLDQRYGLNGKLFDLEYNPFDKTGSFKKINYDGTIYFLAPWYCNNCKSYGSERFDIDNVLDTSILGYTIASIDFESSLIVLDNKIKLIIKPIKYVKKNNIVIAGLDSVSNLNLIYGLDINTKPMNDGLYKDIKLPEKITRKRFRTIGSVIDENNRLVDE